MAKINQAYLVAASILLVVVLGLGFYFNVFASITGSVLSPIPTSAATILSAGDMRVSTEAINTFGPSQSTNDTVARIVLTPSGGGESAWVQMERPLANIGGYALQNNINIGANIRDLKCSYTINKVSSTGYFQPMKLSVYPITMTASNVNNAGCKACLAAGPQTISSPTAFAGYCTSFLNPWSSCIQDFKNLCTNADTTSNRWLTSTTGVITLPIIGGTVGGSPGYICAKVVTDTSQLYNYYTSSRLSSKVKVNVAITNSISNEIVTVGNYNANLGAYSSDNKVYVSMNDASFQSLGGEACQDKATFHIIKTPSGQVYKKDANTPVAISAFTGCTLGADYSYCNNEVTNWNTAQRTNTLSGVAEISGGGKVATFSSSDTGTYDDVRWADGTQYGLNAFYPIIIVEAKGTFLGIQRPEANPTITNIAPSSVTVMSATDTKTVTLTISNSGASGIININTNCPSVSVTPATTFTGISVNTGATVSPQARISSTASPGTYTCTFTACGASARNCNSRTLSVNVQRECSLVAYGYCNVNRDCTGYVDTLVCPSGSTKIGTCDGSNSPRCQAEACLQPSPAKANAYWSRDTCSWWCNAGYTENSARECIAGTCAGQITVCHPGYRIAVGPDGCNMCEQICTADSQCPTGWTCVSGTCTAPPPTCSQQVDARVCNVNILAGQFDILCPISKSIDKVGCSLQDLVSNIVYIIIGVGVIAAVGLGVFILMKKKGIRVRRK